MLKGVGLVSNGVTRCATADSQVPNNVFYFEPSASADVAAPAATVIFSEKLHSNQVTQVTSVNLFGKSALVADVLHCLFPKKQPEFTQCFSFCCSYTQTDPVAI